MSNITTDTRNRLISALGCKGNADEIINLLNVKIARGTQAVTGTATVVTGLSTVIAVVATAQTDPDGVGLAEVSATVGDQAGTPAAGSVILKCWKVTGTGDATLIAATAAKTVNWIAIGTAFLLMLGGAF